MCNLILIYCLTSIHHQQKRGNRMSPGREKGKWYRKRKKVIQMEEREESETRETNDSIVDRSKKQNL